MARSEDNTGQPVVVGVEHGIVDEEEVGFPAPEIVGERQPGHQGTDDEDAHCETEEEPGKDPQRALGKEHQR